MATKKAEKTAPIAIVSLRWNGQTLKVKALSNGGRAVVGDDAETLAPLPFDVIGAKVRTIADTKEGAHVHIPEGHVARVVDKNGNRILAAGPLRLALLPGWEASIHWGDFEAIVAGHESERTRSKTKWAAGAWVHTAVVAAVHAGFLFAGSRAALASAVENEQELDHAALKGYLAAADERSNAADKMVFGDGKSNDSKEANGQSGNGFFGGGKRHEGDSGKAGSTTSRDRNKHWGSENKPTASVRGADDDLELARNFGMVGLIQSMNKASPFSTETAVNWGSNDVLTAVGGMLGRTVGESEGAGGLALSGVGEGGGGRGHGIGLGVVGTVGHTNGNPGLGTGGTGNLLGMGFGISGSWGNRSMLAGRRVRLWRGDGWGTSVSGRLPPEAIQRIVRQNFGRFRACYEAGLLKNPALAGRVSVNFVIGRDGAVSSVAEGGSDLPNAAVRSCVVRAFYGISFPQPEGGIVNVSYPIAFSPT
ncbi:MAG: AgmX/PglI C-terminal domain-containing protein [Polyangiaceae bacterium]|nr:AgmX/PglI C-terminal domain-containing protein [Polyangiaceae bacterium]